MREVVFVDGMRTAFSKQGGTLKDIFATDLGAAVVKALVAKTGIYERGGKVDSVMCGSAAHCPHSFSPARYVSMAAGLPFETSASYVEMQCGSAIAALNHAAYRIMADDADCVIVGGAESFSQRFFKFSTSQEPYKMIPPTAFPSNLAPKAEDNIITGTVAKTVITPDANTTCYVLANGEDGVGLYKALKNKNASGAEGDTSFFNNACKVYIPVSVAEPQAARALTMRLGRGSQGGTTSIESSELNAQGAQLIYDLQGRRVLNPTKGMYIVNGKKMVIK